MANKLSGSSEVAISETSPYSEDFVLHQATSLFNGTGINILFYIIPKCPALTLYLVMAPKRWASDEQNAFLTSKKDAFFAAQRAASVTQFWPILFHDWFLKYPERLAVFGPEHNQTRMLTAEEEGQVIAARDKCKDVSNAIVIIATSDHTGADLFGL